MKTTAVYGGRPKGAKTRFKGIGRLAENLQVTPEHLRLVLKGERQGSDRVVRGVFKLMKSARSDSKSNTRN